jgi:hypothetical protein
LSVCSGSFESPQLGVTFTAEGTQRIARLFELSYLGKHLVRCKMRLDNHANDGLRRFVTAAELDSTRIWLISAYTLTNAATSAS